MFIRKKNESELEESSKNKPNFDSDSENNSSISKSGVDSNFETPSAV